MSLSYAWPGQLAYLVLKLKEVAAAGCQGQEADCQGGEVASAGVKLVLRVADGNISEIYKDWNFGLKRYFSVPFRSNGHGGVGGPVEGKLSEGQNNGHQAGKHLQRIVISHKEVFLPTCSL